MNKPFNPDSRSNAPWEVPSKRTRFDISTINESEDQIRNLKASESVDTAFRAAGIQNPPPDVAAIITTFIKNATKGIPISQLANMAPGSGDLGTLAARGVNLLVNSMSATQLQAMKAGVNQLDPSAVLKFNAELNKILGGRGSDAASGDRSSARYDGLGSSSDWNSPAGQAQMRELAIKSGLGWAANNPDLLRLGPSAIQALADVHLQKESYERFKKGGLSEKGIVGGARWSKRTGTDYNEFSKTHEATQQALPAADQQAHSQAVEQYFKAVGSEKPPTPAEEEAAKDTFNKSMEPIKQRNPEAVQKIEREQTVLQTQLKQEKDATAKTDKKEATADVKDAKADAMLAALTSNSPGSSGPQKPETPPPATSSQAKPDAAKPPKPADRSAPKP
jgi:hypothetical protein